MASTNDIQASDVGGQSGDRGGGGGSAMVVNLSFFLMSRRLFLWKRCR
jgi:hypothetical protein